MADSSDDYAITGFFAGEYDHKVRSNENAARALANKLQRAGILSAHVERDGFVIKRWNVYVPNTYRGLSFAIWNAPEFDGNAMVPIIRNGTDNARAKSIANALKMKGYDPQVDVNSSSTTTGPMGLAPAILPFGQTHTAGFALPLGGRNLGSTKAYNIFVPLKQAKAAYDYMQSISQN